MKVKVGESATVTLMVDIKFRCSSCGKDNKVTIPMQGYAYTSTVMGFNIDRDLSGTATEELNDKFAAVLDESNPHRFRKAGISCICGYCCHKEPWARMTYERLAIPSVISAFIAFPSLIILFFALGQLTFNTIHQIAAILLILSSTTLWAINRYITKNDEELEKQIAELPVESLPTFSISPHKRPFKY